MYRCLLVGCAASLLCSLANGEDLLTPSQLAAEVSDSRNELSLPVLRFADGGDDYFSNISKKPVSAELPNVRPVVKVVQEPQAPSRKQNFDSLKDTRDDLRTDSLDQSSAADHWVGDRTATSTHDHWVGDRGISSIRSIRFVAPRSTDQSSVFREPRTSAMHSTVSWVSPRAVHRTLYFNDNPLERDGKTNHQKLQPFVSALRFATDAAKYPFRRVTDLYRGDPVHYAKSPR